MNFARDWKSILGWVLHLMVAGLMIFAGSAKVFFAPKEILEGMTKSGLGGQVGLIGTGELISAILLLIPRTASLGLLLTSAFWGGVICIHMAHQESYAAGSVFLVLTWLGAWLRIPGAFSSFQGAPRRDLA